MVAWQRGRGLFKVGLTVSRKATERLRAELQRRSSGDQEITAQHRRVTVTGPCDGATPMSRIRHLSRFDNFGLHPRGDHGQGTRAADYSQDRRTQPRPQTWRDGKFVVKSSNWNENQVFLKDDKLEVAVKSGRLVMAHLPTGRPAEDTTSRRSRWRVTVTAQRQSDVVTRHRHAKWRRHFNAATGVQPVRFARGRR